MSEDIRVGAGWRYRCKSCGFEVTLDAALPPECPRCHARGWWGRMVTKDNGRKARKRAAGAVTIPTGILSQEKPSKTVASGNSEGISGGVPVDKKNGPGRPPLPVPEALVRVLDQKGLSSREIQEELGERGYVISYKSVQRVLNGTRTRRLLIQ